MANVRRPKRLSRAEAQARTRDLLIEAAREELVRKGMAASVRDIAERAGFTQGALYANFESKEAILLELLRRHMAHAAQGTGAMLAGGKGTTALAALEKWATAIDGTSDWPAVALELQLHAHRSPAFAAEYDRVLAAPQQALSEVIASLFASLGLKPPGPPTAIGRGLLAMANGLALDRGGGADQSTGTTVMMFLKALIATAKPARGSRRRR